VNKDSQWVLCSFERMYNRAFSPCPGSDPRYVKGLRNSGWAGGSESIQSNGNLWKTKKNVTNYACFCSV